MDYKFFVPPFIGLFTIGVVYFILDKTSNNEISLNDYQILAAEVGTYYCPSAKKQFNNLMISKGEIREFDKKSIDNKLNSCALKEIKSQIIYDVKSEEEKPTPSYRIINLSAL